MSSDESENFYRVTSLLMDVATDVLRKLFEVLVLLASPSVESFLQIQQGKINHLQSKKVLRQDQVVLLTPPSSGTVDLQAWDISLFCVVLKNLLGATTNPAIMVEVNNLRQIRNKVYGHSSLAAMSTTDFGQHWSDIEATIKALLPNCNDQSFEQAVLDRMVKVKSGPLDIGSTVQMLKDWYNQDRDLGGRLDTVSGQLDQLVLQVKGLAVQQPLPNPVLQKLKKHSSLTIQEVQSQCHVTTALVSRAGQLLDTHGVVTITGGPGEGKTMAAIALMTSRYPLDRCLILQDPAHWEHVDRTEVDVVLLEDMFGRRVFDQARFQSWRPILDFIQTAVKNANDVSVVITTCSDVLAERLTELTRYDMFTNRIAFLSSELTISEKEEILSNVLRHYGKDVFISEEEISECVRHFDGQIGFPLCCKLFALDDQLLNQREHYFARPYKLFRSIFISLKPESLASLLFLFYKKDSCPDAELRLARRVGNSEDQELLAFLTGVVGGTSFDLTLPSIKEHLVNMSGLYVKHEGKSFSFMNRTVYDCIALYHAETYPDEVIEQSTPSFLSNCIATVPSGQSETLVVTAEYYDVLANRIIAEHIGIHPTGDVTRHSCFKTKKFCKVIFRLLAEKGELKKFMETGNGFLVSFVDQNDDDLSTSLVQEAVVYLACDHSETVGGEGCWTCNIKAAVMFEASRLGHKRTMDALQDDGVPLPKASVTKDTK